MLATYLAAKGSATQSVRLGKQRRQPRTPMTADGWGLGGGGGGVGRDGAMHAVKSTDAKAVAMIRAVAFSTGKTIHAERRRQAFEAFRGWSPFRPMSPVFFAFLCFFARRLDVMDLIAVVHDLRVLNCWAAAEAVASIAASN